MNGKVILICGKICCGKTFYANKLLKENKAVILSVDEIMLALFGQHLGEKHDEISGKTQEYLFNKAAEIAGTGINVILDWGFWQKEKRAAAKGFFAEKNIPCELHYVDISEERRKENIEKRNAEVEAGKVSAYYVDENLAAKFAERFEEPEKGEVEVWHSI